MAELRMEIVTLTDIDGNAIPGEMAVCGNCGECEFVITRINSQNHPHYQCLGCTTSYCGTWDGEQCGGMRQ